MGLLNIGAQIMAKFNRRRFKSWQNKAVNLQEKEFNKLIAKGKKTSFGKEHNFDSINNYEDFKNSVPIIDYEGIKPYIERIRQGEENVLWPAKTIYFAKTSGTTSGAKYLPITTDSIGNHINSTRYALLNYVLKTGKTNFLDGKLMFVSGNPELDKQGQILTGRLSGIVNHHVPNFLRKNQLPSYKTNCIKSWEDKVDNIIKETQNQNMTLIGGIPPWVEMYFERLLDQTRKNTINEIFPNLSLLVHGGVSFQPYEKRIKQLIGANIDFLELYPASEGFLAFQDEFPGNDLLIIPDTGIFFEFIPVEEFDKPDASRLSLREVEAGKQYVLIINSNAGLWGYNIGDTVQITSTNPYKLIITGRIKQFTSTFGEHVIVQEAESAIEEACKKTGAEIIEFTVAPLTSNPNGLPCHEWFIEFSKKPDSIEEFRKTLDNLMQEKNIYYYDLVQGKILQPLIIKQIKENGFYEYMKSIGKFGGQNKIPHLKNDRSIADFLKSFVEEE